MKVIIVGCGRLGSELAHLLYSHGNDVALIDKNETAFEKLKPDFKGIMIEGDALNQDILKRAGIENADALAVVTSSDSINLVVGRVAAKVYNIKNVVARNFEPNLSELFEIFGLEMISGTNWAASRLEEIILNEKFKLVYSIGNGEVDYYQLIVPPDFDGKTIAELEPLAGELAVASLTRLGKSFIPGQQEMLSAGDRLHVSATHRGIEALRLKLGLGE